MRDIERCQEFLVKNGWEEIQRTDESVSYGKRGSIGIDLCENEIVFIGGSGDFLHVPVTDGYYALIGELIEFRQLPFTYIST